MIGADEIILLEPRAMKVKGNSIDVEKSEKLEIDLREVVERFKGTAKVSVYKVGSLEYKQHGTYMYNQKAALANSLSHLIEYETFNVFPVDYARNQEIINDFGTNKVAFIFIQSVTNDILDVRLESWHWEEGDDFVPLVMPRDFMLMLNQFASAYKMPAISEEIAKTLNFKLELRGKGARKSYDSRIIGFSNQMNGVLVPTGFMNFGNAQFSDNVSQDITQVVIVMNERKYSDFEQIMDDLNLDIKENELLVVKVQAVLFVVLSFLLLIALVIIFLSAMMIIQFSLLVLANSQYEIQTLLRLGYHPIDLARYFYRYFLRLLVFVVLMMFPIFILLKTFLDKNIQNFGFSVSFWPSWLGLAMVVFLCWAIVYANFVRVRSNIIKQC
jgi:hypothetical protein